MSLLNWTGVNQSEYNSHRPDWWLLQICGREFGWNRQNISCKITASLLSNHHTIKMDTCNSSGKEWLVVSRAPCWMLLTFSESAADPTAAHVGAAVAAEPTAASIMLLFEGIWHLSGTWWRSSWLNVTNHIFYLISTSGHTTEEIFQLVL